MKKGVYLFIIIGVFFLFMIPFSLAVVNPNSFVETYEYPTDAPRSSVFSVTANGKDVFVERHYGINHAHFSFAGEVEIKITISGDVDDYVLSPRSYNYQYTTSGNTITLKLDKPRKIIVHDPNADPDNDDDNPKLFIYADPLEEKPDINDPNVVNILDLGADNTGNSDASDEINQALDSTSGTGKIVYVPKGEYRINSAISFKDDTTLYLEGGARLLEPSGTDGQFLFSGCNNVRLYGRGMVYNGNRDVKYYFKYASNINISGIMILTYGNQFLSSRIIARIVNSEDIYFYNVKNVEPHGDLNDGLDPDCSNGVLFDNVILRVGDDNTATKASRGVDHRDFVGNLNVRNSIVWGYQGAGLKLGTETMNANRIENLTYENCDVIDADVALDVTPYDSAEVSNILYRNCRVERAKGEDNKGLVIEVKQNHGTWSPYPRSPPTGTIRDVYFENIHSLDDEGTDIRLDGWSSSVNIARM